MIRKLALRTLLHEKTRFVCLVISIVLTVVLFTVVFSAFVGIQRASEHYNIKQSGTMCHFIVDDWDIYNDKLLNDIIDNPMTRSAGVRKFLAYTNDRRLNYNVEVNYEDLAYAQSGFYSLTDGKMPMKYNEVAVDTTTLDVLGIPLKEGSVFLIDISAGEITKTETFVLTGWFEMNQTYQNKIGQIIVSKEYLAIWEHDFCEDALYGTQELGVVLYESRDIEEKAKKVLSEVGAEDRISDIRVNPYYETSIAILSSKDLIVLLFCIGIIAAVGYLIVNNIFSINAIKDTKLYGQLKTLGMDNKQIATYVCWQSFFLLLVSIPVGGIVGILVSRIALPAIVRLTNYRTVANDSLLEINHLSLALGAAIIFVILTVFISVFKPIRIIQKMPPIETKNIEVFSNRNSGRNDGSRLYKFAFFNVTRNIRGMILLVISISLPLLLVNIAYSVYYSFDMEKYISSVMYSDYIVANNNYFRSEYLSNNGDNHPLDQAAVEEIRKYDYIKDVVCVYASSDVLNLNVVCDDKEDVWLNVYGLEDLHGVEQLIVEKNVDEQAFYIGSGLIEGCWIDENGIMIPGSYQYEKGDTVIIEDSNGNTNEYTVLGHINIGKGALSTGITNGGICFELYFNSDVYEELMNNKNVMSYSFNVENEHKNEIEKSLENLKNVSPDLDFHSRKTFENEFHSLKMFFELVCFFLCLVLVIIALINIINVFVTNIIIRNKEIATLRSIGMSRKQLSYMFMWEISYYLMMAFGLSAIISLIASNTIVANMCNEISFLRYSFRMEIYLVVLIVSYLVGFITIHMIQKSMIGKSITEQLRTD